MRPTTKPFVSTLLTVCLLLGVALPAYAAAPVAASFSTAVPANRQSLIQLQGSDADGSSLTYATTSTPSHGALSSLNTSTGYVVYTPAAGYTGSDSFTYTVTSGGETSAAGTVTISVTNAKTTVTDTITDPSGGPRSGKVTFILTQAVTTPAGLAPVGSSVSASLSSSGTFSLAVYPSRSMSPAAYYQVWFTDGATLRQELLGVYDIPAATSAVALSPYKVTDTNLAARYTFATAAGLEALSVAVSNAAVAQLMSLSRTTGKLQYWNGTNLADSLVSQAGGVVTIGGNTTVSGTVTAAGYTGIQAANVPDLDASKITSGTLGAARIPNLDASKVTTGVFPGSLIPGVDASKITSGTLPNERTTATSANTPSTIVARDSGGGISVGTVTATNLVGNGAGITGLTGATGGVSNAGSTTVRHDSDNDGVGVTDIQGRDGVTGLRVENDATVNVLTYLKLPARTKADMLSCVVACSGALVRVTDAERGEWFNNGSGWRRLRNYLDVSLDFGAKGDGTTDDTAAVNAAITALNGAGGAVRTLYFPAGDYKVTASLTPIAVPFLVLGDGGGRATAYVSRITSTSATATLFTVTAMKGRFKDISVYNDAATPPTAGAGIVVTTPGLPGATSFAESINQIDFDSIHVEGFYDNLDIQSGAVWYMRGSNIEAPVRYGVRIRNLNVADNGDWSISDSFFAQATYASEAAIQIESAGGGKITNVKINGASGAPGGLSFNNPINVALTTPASTGILLVNNTSIENCRGDGIKIGTGYHLITLTNLQFGLYGNTTGELVHLTSVKNAVIDNVVAQQSFTTPSNLAFRVENSENVQIGSYSLKYYSFATAFDGTYTPAGTGDTSRFLNASDFSALANGWSSHVDHFPVGFGYINGEVVLRGGLTGGTFTNGTTVLNLPVGFRPTKKATFTSHNFTGAVQNVAIIEVNSDGAVKIYNATGNSVISLGGVRFTP